MKRAVLFVMFLGLLTSCTRDKDHISPGLVGSWKLIETLADPGDGSGTFQAVDNGRVIEFKSDGTIMADEKLCGSDSVFSVPMVVGTFSVSDLTIERFNCENYRSKISFELKNENLILDFHCFEPCLQKYRKIQ